MNRDFNSVISILVSHNIDHRTIDQTESYLERITKRYLSTDDVLTLVNNCRLPLNKNDMYARGYADALDKVTGMIEKKNNEQ